MKILSLFDGISCGMVALKRAGIAVERYDAFEIDKYAIKISENNYPQIVHHGDVFDGNFTDFKGYDLLLGGSPCTYWSVAKKGRETSPDGIGGKLFMEYVRALRESECRYFLYENNNSIHKNIKDFISDQLGVEPIMINSALVSAQQRKRCYWTNIPNVTQPIDRGILLKEILESGAAINDFNGKARTVKAQYKNTSLANIVRTDSFGASMVAVPVRIGQIGNGGIGERIYSVYGKSVSLKANGGGGGAKTGLYAVPFMRVTEGTTQGYVDIMPGECVDLSYPNSPTRRGRSMRNKTNCLTTFCELYQYCGTTEKPICKVKNGLVEIGEKSYPIKIKDGCYLIRKLSPVECERLQTLPDNYTEGISNTKRYKCIGNGWTVDVIAHILEFIPK